MLAALSQSVWPLCMKQEAVLPPPPEATNTGIVELSVENMKAAGLATVDGAVFVGKMSLEGAKAVGSATVDGAVFVGKMSLDGAKAVGEGVKATGGLLVTGLDHNPTTRKLMQSSQVPCVHLMDLPASPEADAPYCVGFRQNEAGAALTRHLLATGRRRIAFAGAQLDPRVMQRLYGWRSALQEAGCYEPTLEWLNPASSSLALGGVMFEQIMGQSPAVDAIFFCNDDLAQGALLAALRLKIAVPSRIAIAGFNDLTGSDQMLPPLTSVRTPRAQIGEAGANMLLALMRGETQATACVDLGFELVQRGST